MLVKIPTSKTEIFKKYLVIINGLLSEEKKLTGIEIDVLEKMLYIDYIYRDKSKSDRDKIIFHRVTKDRIREDVYGISSQSYNNIITKLRKKGMIEGNSLKAITPIKNGKIELEFKLEINDGE